MTVPAATKQKIVKQRSSGMPIRKIAESNGIAVSTCQHILARYGTSMESIDQFDKNKGKILQAMQDKALQVAHKVLDSMVAEDTGSWTSGQKADVIRTLATAFGIFYDKYRLESGQSTSNVASLLIGAQRARFEDGKDDPTDKP